MMIKPDRTPVIIGQVGNDIAFADIHQSPLHRIGLDPLNRPLFTQDVIEEDGANDSVKIRSGYNPHKKTPSPLNRKKPKNLLMF
jgi:hypothetical protein